MRYQPSPRAQQCSRESAMRRGLCTSCSTHGEDRSRISDNRSAPAPRSNDDDCLVGVVHLTPRAGDARSTLAREQLSSCIIVLSTGVVPAAVRQSRNTTPLGRELHVDWLRFNCTYPPLHMRVMKGIPARQPLLASSIEHDQSELLQHHLACSCTRHLCVGVMVVADPMEFARLILRRKFKDT